jgi:tRNA(Ile)-lysidine synthase
LYWLPEPWLQEPPVLQLTICCAGRYALPNNGYLTVTGELRAPLQVRYRQGAERMLIEGRGHRDLKRLLQEQDIPAFLRPRLPLVFQQEQLLAVANLPHLNHSDLGIVRIDWQLTAVDESVPYMGGTVSK